MLMSIPLLAIPLILYNFVAVTRGPIWGDLAFQFEMVRGELFTLTYGGLFLLFALFLLFIEILKATRTGTGSIVDHLLSTLVFIVALVEFLLIGAAASEVFFLFTVIALIDVVAGYSITIRSARRDVAIDPSALG